MTERRQCGACGGGTLKVFLDLGKTPLANSFPAYETEAETWYPLRLGRCLNCGLVQMMEIISDAEIYGDDYGFFSGGSQAQREYHQAGAELLLDRFGKPSFTVEVACNDGSLLQHFVNQDCSALGVDPALPADLAIKNGLPVLRAAFTAELAREIREERGPADLVIAYNSLAHVGNISDVLTGVWELLDTDGFAVVEVQYLPDLLAGNMYDQVYHEHRYFYSLTSFAHVATLHGLNVVDAELIELQGGGMRVTLSRRQNVSPSQRAHLIFTSERWLNLDCMYDGVQGRIDRARDHLLTIFTNERKLGREVVGYSAAAKATTILNYCGFTRKMLPCVIDTTPYKQGRFVPGVKIPIVAPEPVGDTRLLLAPNYLAHVLRADREFIDRGGKWLVPIPTPVLI
jgi:methylation protein EvaC